MSAHETRGSSPSTQIHSDRGRDDSTRFETHTSPPADHAASVREPKICRHQGTWMVPGATIASTESEPARLMGWSGKSEQNVCTSSRRVTVLTKLCGVNNDWRSFILMITRFCRCANAGVAIVPTLLITAVVMNITTTNLNQRADRPLDTQHASDTNNTGDKGMYRSMSPPCHTAADASTRAAVMDQEAT